MENACKSCSLGIVLLFACATFAYVNHTATFKPKFRSTDGKLLEYIVKIISNHVENGRYKRSDGVTNGTQFQVPVADSMTSTRGDNINNNTVDLNHLYNNSNEYEITKNFSNLNCSEFVVNKTERYFCESETDNQTRNSVNPLKALQLPENEDRGISNRNGVILVEEKSSNHVNSKDNKEYHTCRRSARCEPLNHTMCFGATLYYKQTSLSLVNSTANQNEIQEQLQKWNSLRSVPKCWALIQTLLCSVYMPRCDNGMVDLPSHEMCRVTRYPCRIVESTLGWPDFLKCGYEKNFPSLCKTETRELRFNTNSWCQAPLVMTDASTSWYDSWEGCGLQCHNPLFTEEEHKEIHYFIGVVGCICLISSLFTVLTFFIDWKSANKYPALIIFYISWCYVISCIGWLAQFTPGARDDIVCRRDGTVRKSEPTYGENLSCVIVFVMVYYFLVASVIWFDMLAYSWYISFKALGKIRESIEAKTAYFHLVAWSLPLVLTIAILALAQVDGDSVSGICFVGHFNWFTRVGFLLVPVSVSIIVGEFFLIRGLVVLVKLKIGSDSLISEKASLKIRETIIRLGIFATSSFLFVFITYVCHMYEYAHQREWESSLRKFIICKSNLTSNTSSPETCILESRPSIIMIQIHLLALFGAGISISTWIWTPSTLDTWKRFLRRACKQPINEPIKLTKHKMIAKAFAKRRELNGGKMSFSFQSTHDDPLGMNFDLNSVASQEISSTWQAALPKFITRRGALMGARDLGLRRNSSASDFSQQQPSLDTKFTRRHSLDSQISFHMSEHERMTYMAHAREQRRKKKKGVRRRGRNARVVPNLGLASLQRQRRGSDTSQHSDFGHLIPHHLLATEKINNIKKEAIDANQKKVSQRRTGFFRPLPSLKLPEVFSHKPKNTLDLFQKIGNYNRGFSVGQDTSQQRSFKHVALPMMEVALPGQIGIEEGNRDDPNSVSEHSLALNQPSTSFGRRGPSAGKIWEDDSKSNISTDNESLHKLGEELSSKILIRAIRDSQSDLENANLVCSSATTGLQLHNLRQKTEEGLSNLNNCFISGRSTVVDMFMDNDNRDSSSS